ncbi:MAG: hypothetical protein R2695_16385 [Acidimicrobiales bacterium]
MKESIVLLVLGACWAAYGAFYVRDSRRSSHRRSDGIRSFSSGLGSLGATALRSPGFDRGSAGLAPRTASDAARRRREVALSLVVLALITFFAALSFGGVLVVFHLLVDVALAAYGYALMQRRNDAAEREMKVHMLYPERQVDLAPAPAEAVNG